MGCIGGGLVVMLEISRVVLEIFGGMVEGLSGRGDGILGWILREEV